MSAPEIILELVERFNRNIDQYKSAAYNETQLRREFIDPLFEALGWDVNNKQGYAEPYKDVIHEDSLKIGINMTAPDYAFRIGGTRKFFVEAKRPSVYIKEDISPAFQLRRYAWSAKLSLSILTDFEEFALYDCRIKPVKTDKASTARVKYIHFSEYADRWDEIAGIFSREAVLKGSFDKYADSTKSKKGTAEVDDVFLKEIESWRESLARNIALRNPGLSQRELNFAVQSTIDRIIFLRICEDRGIETYGQLMALRNGVNVYDRLRILFQRADDRYNSGLFHFQEEKGRPETPDTLTPRLTIDDKPLKGIFKNLYYPDSPYEFSVLSSDILGQVYEQFLGKVIRLTAGHTAVIEDKPEVKKAGGVYYTPTYIVDYIVEQTVGKLLEGKTPRQASKVKVLDPACGSGSFLIGAYEYILDWHLKYYSETPEKHKKELYQGSGGDWRLATAEKKRILLNNIHGVDIDTQAVEVTKLSLLLKVLEGESDETLARQLKLFHERALPDLGSNIKCGNSLIGPDFYENQQLGLLDEEEAYRINVFDWIAQFPEIMQSGGFDAVIGNPPYIRIQTIKEWAPLEVEFYKKRYVSASKGNYDIYVVFVERALKLLSKNGRLGFILPHKFFNSKYGEPLREIISKGKHLTHIVHFGDQQVFRGAATYTCLMFLAKQPQSQIEFLRVIDITAWRLEKGKPGDIIPATAIRSNEWGFVLGASAQLFEKLHGMPVKLKQLAERISQGIRTSANELYVLDLISESNSQITAYSKQLRREVILDGQIVQRFLQGREIKPYHIMPSRKIVLIPYSLDKTTGKSILLSEAELQQVYPNAYAYLKENKAFLEERERGRMRGRGWYGYIYPKNIDLMTERKLVTPDIANRASFALDESGEYAFTSGYGIVLKQNANESIKYVLGLLNSKVLDFFLKRISTTIRGGYFRYFTQYMEQLPIRTIDFSNPTEKAQHDKMVALVERMLELHKKLAGANLTHDKQVIQTQIDATGKQIDELVYELYNLTDDEIKIIEESTK